MPATRSAPVDTTGTLPHLSWDNVLAWRMDRHRLTRPAPARATLDVVSTLSGLHAQVMSSAELTLWARIDGLAPDAVSTMLWRDRTLLKTWAMRGTLHLLPSSELPLWVAAQSVAKPRYHAGSWQKAFGVSRQEMETILATLPAVLDGRHLSREELAATLAKATGLAHLEQRLADSWGSVLKPLAFAGAICFAPGEGRSVRFTRPDQWLSNWTVVDPEQAQTTVVYRYLGVNGPATREEFARWTGWLTAAQAGRAITSLGDDVAEVDVDGGRAWALATDVDAIAKARPVGAIRLLPAFDQYVVAAPREQEAVLRAEHRARVYRPQGWFSPVVVRDGEMVGTWRHERKGTRLAVAIEPFGRLTTTEKDRVADEAERLASFLDGNLALTFAQPG